MCKIHNSFDKAAKMNLVFSVIGHFPSIKKKTCGWAAICTRIAGRYLTRLNEFLVHNTRNVSFHCWLRSVATNNDHIWLSQDSHNISGIYIEDIHEKYDSGYISTCHGGLNLLTLNEVRNTKMTIKTIYYICTRIYIYIYMYIYMYISYHLSKCLSQYQTDDDR